LVHDIEDGSLEGIELWRSFESEGTGNGVREVTETEDQ
jgi:hypothetical protein